MAIEGSGMQVFICYARIDKDFAAHLVEDLNAYDLTIWMDVRNIPHGANWDIEVKKGLDSSDIMLVLLTPASSASASVTDEWSYFIEKNKRIIPVLVEQCEVPFRLSRRQHVDMTGDYQRGFEQLLKAIDSPSLKDPDRTEKIRVRPVKTMTTPPPTSAYSASASGSSASIPVAVAAAAVAPEVSARLLPVVWGNTYHWFNGMGRDATHGDAMIYNQELK